MSVRLFDFSKTDYFGQSVKDEEQFKKNIFIKNTVNFSYDSVSYKDFKPKERSLAQRIQILPILDGVIEIIGNVAGIAFELIGFTWCLLNQILSFKSLKERVSNLNFAFQRVKVPVYDIIRSLEGIVGNLISPFHDRAGAFLEQDKRFQKDCYNIWEQQAAHLETIKAKYEKMSLSEFNLSPNKEEILKELTSHPKILNGTFIQHTGSLTYIALVNNSAVADTLSITDLVENSENVQFALMEPQEANQIKLSGIREHSKKTLTIIEGKLTAKAVDSLPTNISNLTLCELRGLTAEQLNSCILLLPPTAVNFLTDEQIESIDFTNKSIGKDRLKELLEGFKTKTVSEKQIFDLAEITPKPYLALLFNLLQKKHFETMNPNPQKLAVLDSIFSFTSSDQSFTKKSELLRSLNYDRLAPHTKEIPPVLFNYIKGQIEKLTIAELTESQIAVLFRRPISTAFNSVDDYQAALANFTETAKFLWSRLNSEQRNTLRPKLNKELAALLDTTFGI